MHPLVLVGVRTTPFFSTAALMSRWIITPCVVPRGTGRVPLSKFYGKSITDAEWRFGESESYLRALSLWGSVGVAAVFIWHLLNVHANAREYGSTIYIYIEVVL